MQRGLKIAGIALAPLLLAVIVLPFLIDANQFRPALESRLTESLGRQVKVGTLSLALLTGSITAADLSIADDPKFSHSAFVQAKSLHVGVDLPSLIFSRKLVVTSLVIEQPQIWLLQSPSGEWNFSSLGATTATAPPAQSTSPANSQKLDLSVKLVKISDGQFTLGRTGGHAKPLVLQRVEARLQDFGAASVFPFSLSMTIAGGGSMQLTGKAGPIAQGDIALTPATLSLKIDKLDVAASGVSEAAPQVAGLVSVDGDGEAAGGGVHVTGKVKVDRWRLSSRGTAANRNLELDFDVTHDVKKGSGVVKQGDIHIGGAVARLTGAYAPQGESMVVAMNLTGASMPVEELAQMLPAMGIVLPNGSSLKGGTAEVRAAVSGPMDKLVTIGSVSLNKTTLAGFNLSSRLSGVEKLAGINSGPNAEIEIFNSDIRVAPDGMHAENIRLVLPAVGSLNGAGTVSPENNLNFRLQAAVRTGGVAAALSNEPVPFTVQGTCAEPVFRPDLAAVVKGEFKGVGKAAGGLVKGLLGRKK